MALPAIVALPVIGLIVWGASRSAKGKKKNGGRDGMRFVDDYTGLVINDMDAAMASRDAAIDANAFQHSRTNVLHSDARAVLLRWMRMVSPSREESRANKLLGDPDAPGFVMYAGDTPAAYGQGFTVPDNPTELQRAQAALLIRLWDSLLDGMWDRGLVEDTYYMSAEDNYLMQANVVWETMGHYDLTEEDVMELAEIEETD